MTGTTRPRRSRATRWVWSHRLHVVADRLVLRGKVLGTQLTPILRYVEVTKTNAAGHVASDEITASKPGAAPVDEHCSFSFQGEDGLAVTTSWEFLRLGPDSA